MEHFVVTDNLKISMIILYLSIFFIIFCSKVLQYFYKINVENLLVRMRSFLFIIIFFTIAFSFTKLIAIIFLAIISYLCLKEFLSLIPIRKTDRPALVFAYWSIPFQFYFVYINWGTMFYLFIPLYMFIMISTMMVISNNTKGFLKTLAVIQYGVMTTVYAIGYLAMISIIPFDYNLKGGSLGLLFYILVLAVSNDFFQMLFGKVFGKNKIMHNISPNKTWEGLFGGIICSSILSVIMGILLTPMSIVQSLFVGASLSIFGFLGDVTISAIKRDIGVKDTSSLIPGHGGILDRFDSLIYLAPLFFHYIAYICNVQIVRF
ncbi:MAG: phosphatidate cytidylyltransferase [bacterium]|nr:phosphatidate cytidylyltransferase [bacterium]